LRRANGGAAQNEHNSAKDSFHWLPPEDQNDIESKCVYLGKYLTISVREANVAFTRATQKSPHANGLR
jgi:hypothetical protein